MLLDSTLYRLQDLIIDINTKRDTGVIVYLNFYPRTNYIFSVCDIGGKTLRETVGSGRIFHDSATVFRDHIAAYRVSTNCYVELTELQEKMLQITS